MDMIIEFIIFFYLPAFVGYSCYVKIEYAMVDGEALMTDEIMVRVSVVVISMIAVFYLLQRRELKRFVQQQDLVKKEQLASRKE